MVVVLEDHGIAYFPIPKNANTSIKQGLRAALGDEALTITWNGPLSPRARWLARGCYRVAVVRDPVQRMLSVYGDRVLTRRDLERTRADLIACRLAGLPTRPGPDAFFRRLHRYRLMNDKIRRHAMLQRRFLGRDLGWFHAVYRIDELEALAADLSRRTGREVRFPRLKSGGPKFAPGDVSPETRGIIGDYVRPDHALLGALFDAPPA